MGPPFDFPAMPVPLQILIFGAMGLGLLWAVVIYLINFPPPAWCNGPSGGRRGSRRREERVWWRRVWHSWRPSGKRQKKKRKPVDKPSKVAHVFSASASAPGVEDGSGHGGLHEEIATATSLSDHHAHGFTPTLLRRRTLVEQRGCELLPLPAHRTAGSPDGTLSSALDPAQSSPRNPLLPVPALRPRSSADYLAAHTSFFSTDESRPLCPAKANSSSSSLFSFDDADVLEAQTELPSHPRAAYGELKEERGVRRWLAAVDEAVDRAVDGFLRWAEYDGREADLLLPLRGRVIVGRDGDHVPTASSA